MASRISCSFSKNCEYMYLLWHKVVLQNLKSIGSTSKDFDYIKNAVTAVNYKSVIE